MKIVFMGTPDFSVGALEALVAAGHEVTAVVTQPDKAKGRSGQMQFPPVKECALKHNIPVFQPVKVKAPESVEQLRKYEADIFVVAAFGQIVSKEILTMPRLGCVNIHASLLPKYRGASPINWCIINGEKETGVTIMQMDEGIDTGDILTTVKVTIADDETAESLFEKLSKAGAELIVDTLPKLERGEITPIKQNDAESSHTKMMSKSLGEIDWNKSAVEIERLVRGLNSWPSAYTYINGKSVKLWRCEVTDKDFDGTKQAGEIVKVTKDAVEAACGKGILRICELQLEGKKRMDIKSFLLGNQWKEGMRFGKK
ncbi:MAG: methionyl-tRNA formyltransferase [Lachnospiraceae bacterium]|nr:methionyl-tRNA formyltransferase [Lachnospiraceae bacterium]